jgi:hypothetical protein
VGRKRIPLTECSTRLRRRRANRLRHRQQPVRSRSHLGRSHLRPIPLTAVPTYGRSHLRPFPLTVCESSPTGSSRSAAARPSARSSGGEAVAAVRLVASGSAALRRRRAWPGFAPTISWIHCACGRGGSYLQPRAWLCVPKGACARCGYRAAEDRRSADDRNAALQTGRGRSSRPGGPQAGRQCAPNGREPQHKADMTGRLEAVRCLQAGAGTGARPHDMLRTGHATSRSGPATALGEAGGGPAAMECALLRSAATVQKTGDVAHEDLQAAQRSAAHAVWAAGAALAMSPGAGTGMGSACRRLA